MWASKDRPNFVLINTDQHRFDCFSFMRRRRGLVTPHLDNLAMRGMRFSTAYSTCPVCIPQRMSLMSGQLQSTHGVLCNAPIPYWPIEHTLPGELRSTGYQTALIGRDMHLTPTEMGYGFEHQEICTAHLSCDYNRFLDSHAPREANGIWGQRGATQSFVPNPWHLPDWLHYTCWTTDRSIQWLYHRDPSRPFFLTVGYNQPHVPNNPPRYYMDRYLRMNDLDEPAIGDWAIPPVNDGIGVDLDNSPYVDLRGENLHTCLAGYYGSITHLDDSIGRLLTYLAASGLMENTYVIFTSDHGDMLGDHYRFHKSVPYEGAAHIPLFIRGPGIMACSQVDTPVGWHDLMPTLLDLAEVAIPETVRDGVSLAPLLHAKNAGGIRDFIHGECVQHRPRVPFPGQPVEGNTTYEQSMHYVTDGKEKYIWYPMGGIEQFFNLEEDPSECRNLIDDPAHCERVELWRRRLINMLKDRPEGYVEAGRLVAGKEMPRRLPNAQAMYDQWKAVEHLDPSHRHDGLKMLFPIVR